MMEKTKNDVSNYVKNISERRGWKLHDNHDGTLDMLIEGLMNSFNNYNYYNCPCRESQADPKLDKDIICPCKYAPEDIAEFGHCYCALYFKKDFDMSKPIEMIPERRPDPDLL